MCIRDSIGIAACEKQRYCCDYIAAEDTVLMEYPYKQVADLEKLFAEQPKDVYKRQDLGYTRATMA